MFLESTSRNTQTDCLLSETELLRERAGSVGQLTTREPFPRIKLVKEAGGTCERYKLTESFQRHFKDFQNRKSLNMTFDNKIKTDVNLSSQYENNSINDSVFFNSSISVDVICVSGLFILVLLAVALFLRLSKRLRLVEDEIVVVLRLLRRKGELTDETLC